MSLRERIRCVQTFHTGLAEIAVAGGPVTTVRFGPRRLTPQFVVVTSPQGAHDVLSPSDGAFDKEMIVHVQVRALGDNVFNLVHERWLRRRRSLQPIFTEEACHRLCESYGLDRRRDCGGLREDRRA